MVEQPARRVPASPKQTSRPPWHHPTSRTHCRCTSGRVLPAGAVDLGPDPEAGGELRAAAPSEGVLIGRSPQPRLSKNQPAKWVKAVSIRFSHFIASNRLPHVVVLPPALVALTGILGTQAPPERAWFHPPRHQPAWAARRRYWDHHFRPALPCIRPRRRRPGHTPHAFCRSVQPRRQSCSFECGLRPPACSARPR